MFVTSFVFTSCFNSVWIFLCQLCTFVFRLATGLFKLVSTVVFFLFNLNFKGQTGCEKSHKDTFVTDYPWSEILAQVLFSIYRSALKILPIKYFELYFHQKRLLCCKITCLKLIVQYIQMLDDVK